MDPSQWVRRIENLKNICTIKSNQIIADKQENKLKMAKHQIQYQDQMVIWDHKLYN